MHKIHAEIVSILILFNFISHAIYAMFSTLATISAYIAENSFYFVVFSLYLLDQFLMVPKNTFLGPLIFLINNQKQEELIAHRHTLEITGFGELSVRFEEAQMYSKVHHPQRVVSSPLPPKSSQLCENLTQRYTIVSGKMFSQFFCGTQNVLQKNHTSLFCLISSIFVHFGVRVCVVVSDKKLLEASLKNLRDALMTM